MLASEIEVLYTIASLKRLEAISLHPVLHLHVKSLVYTADRLPAYDDYNFNRYKFELQDQEYVNFLPDHQRAAIGLPREGRSIHDWTAGLPQHGWSDAEIKKGWDLYKHMRDEQLASALLARPDPRTIELT